jgi:hypothetical protein
MIQVAFFTVILFFGYTMLKWMQIILLHTGYWFILFSNGIE